MLTHRKLFSKGDPSDWTNYDENAHCYCYLYKRATFSYIQDEPIDEDFCTDSNFIITECSRPGDARWSGSYLELYNPVCAGKKIGIDLQIVRIDEDGNQPNKVALKNILVDSNGFIVLCNNKAYGDNIYGAGTCDGVSIGSAGPTFSGKDTFVLTFGGDVTKAIDIYGNTGPDRETQNISDGRCVRKTSIVTPRRIWNANDWVIFSGNSKTSDMDPHVWKAVDPIEPPDTEVVICDSRASKFKFRFQPRLCADSDNFVHRIGNRRNLRAQHRRHLKKSTNTSDKFWCQESSSTAPPSSAFFRVVIKAKGATETSGDKYLDIGNVQNGDELTIVGMNGGTISTELNIYIYDSGSSKVQEIMFHSSCSMDLSTGDTFGSLELIGFQNDKQSVGF